MDNNFQQRIKTTMIIKEKIVQCAVKHIGAWWCKRCDWSNLNGKYLRNGIVTPTGITWKTWKRSYYSMKRAEMKLRPI